MSLNYTYSFYKQPVYNPVDTGRKLNVYKTFRRRPGSLLNVLCTFNLRPVSMGKQLVLALSGLNPLSLRNNKNSKLKKSGVFPCNKRKIAAKPTINQNLAVSEALSGKF